METEIEKKYKAVYEPLLKQFMAEIESVNPEKLPEPFLPAYGKEYEKSPIKIVFVGMETGTASNLKGFLDLAKENTKNVLNWNGEDMELEEESGYLQFLDWVKSGQTFFGFIIKMLAKFYDVDDWRKLKNDPKKYSQILQSFVWANVNSIERFEITAKGNGVSKENYQKIKEASKVFDKADYLLDVFKPDILILLHYNENDFNYDWLPLSENEFNRSHIDSYCENNLNHYFLKDSETEMFWTYHPAYQKIDFNKIVEVIYSKSKVKI